MRAGPAVQGLGVLALTLGVYAALFDDIAGVAVSGVIALFILFRAALFCRAVTALVSSVVVERTAGKRIIRQGGRLPVRTLVTYDASFPLSVSAEDILPAVAILDGVQVAEERKSGHISIRYVLRPMAAGETSFGGVALFVRDLFFSGTVRVSRSDLCLPFLRVVPESIREQGYGRGIGEGLGEGGGQSLLAGEDIRGFHEYIPGEDLARIDWKLSAKFGSLYIREPEGLSGGAPLVIIDLPDLHDSPRAEDFARFSIAASGEAEGICTHFDACPLLLISGGEIVTYVRGSPEQKEFIAALAAIRPIERAGHLYRYLDPASVRARVRAPPAGGEGAFRGRLISLIPTFGGEKGPLPFRLAVAGAMRSSRAAAVVIYATGRGDCSHLSQVVMEALHQGLGVRLRVPAEEQGHVEREVGAGRTLQVEVI
ncbi:MAG: DUF58 domain-containing protein [Methanofollis sp.]|nr:DUF58 domain-containing protein [Methanofollis sp.]